jgi:hypothetical protein
LRESPPARPGPSERPPAGRPLKAPGLLDEPRDRRLALGGIEWLQHERDFGDAPRPLAYTSLQDEIFALASD